MRNVVDAIEAAESDVQAALGLLRITKQGEALGVFKDRSAQIEGLLIASGEKMRELRGSLGEENT
jgi:hypothetical protein